MKKLISIVVALAMVLSVVPMLAFAADTSTEDTIVLFDITQQDITANEGTSTDLSNFGWTASGDASQGSNSNLRFSLHWTNDGEIKGAEKKAMTVFDSANDSTDRTVVASVNSANDTAGTEKITIEYSWGMRSDKSDNYQSWSFTDIDGNVIAKTYIDAGTATNENGGNAQFKIGKDENHVVVAQGEGSRTNVLALRGIPFKVEAVKQSDGTFVTTYSYDNDKDGEYTELYNENVGEINGFKSISTWVGGWSNQWAAMGLMDLKISYTVDSIAEVTVKTVLSDETPSGIEDDVKSVRAGAEYEYPAPTQRTINVDGVYYVYNETASVRKITPKAGEDNVITLVYDKFEGSGITGSVLDEEGATCWFADPRSLTVKNDDNTISMTYAGYIDNHGAVKATQYNNLTGDYSEVLIRSNFQPDDHNNPTFLELPDHRIMVFYSRHTDEACFYYRVTKLPYDLTTLGEEKYLATANNTTYPSPFILSDDPEHIYLGWRGINWHPTLGRMPIPDENGDTDFDWGPKQIVQSTGARPYAKYTSNGKDEIWVTYTTGHPDNENPNWLYFNKININTMNVTDVNGNVLSNINDGTLAVAKNDASRAFAVDTPSSGTRDWVWEIVNDNGRPVIAMVKISSDKKSHDYWLASHNGTAWVLTDLPDDPTENTFFHQTAGTENCYSGGMTIDKTNPHDVYVSMPVNGVFGKVFEIVKFTLNDDYTAVTNTEYITENSRENNARPYIANGSDEGDLRLTWMNGQYYFWIYDTRWGGKGFPTRMMTLTELKELPVVNTLGETDGEVYEIDGVAQTADAPKGEKFTIAMQLLQNDMSVGGTLLKSGNLEIALEKQTADPKHDYAAVAPKLTAGGKTHKSDNLFSKSDWFHVSVNGTGGDKGQENLGWIDYVVTYDGSNLVTYVNGLIDANLQDVDVTLGETMELGGIDGVIANVRTADTALTQAEVRAATAPAEVVDVDVTINFVDENGIFKTETATAQSGGIFKYEPESVVIEEKGKIYQLDTEASKLSVVVLAEGTKAVTVAYKEIKLGENLITNGDFTNGTTDWTRASDGAQFGGTISDNATYIHGDGKALTNTASAGGSSDTTLRRYISVEPGKTYYLSYYAYNTGDALSSGNNGCMSAFVPVSGKVFGAFGSLVFKDYVTYGGQNSWCNEDQSEVKRSRNDMPYESGMNHKEFMITVPEGADNILISMFAWTAPGRVYYSDFVLREVLTQEEGDFSFTFDGEIAKVENLGSDAKLVVAQYNDKYEMIDVKSADVTDGKGELSVTKVEGAVKMTAYLWNSTENMEPVTKAISVDIK